MTSSVGLFAASPGTVALHSAPPSAVFGASGGGSPLRRLMKGLNGEVALACPRVYSHFQVWLESERHKSQATQSRTADPDVLEEVPGGLFESWNVVTETQRFVNLIT